MPLSVAAPIDVRTRNQRIIDIRNLSESELDPLLQEQIIDWARELDWDFSKSAAMVRQLAEERMLSGAALMDGAELAGYGYTGLDDDKGLIADIFVRPGSHRGNSEAALFRVLLCALIAVPGVRRIESQLMLSEAASARALEGESHLRVFERLLMKLDANYALPSGRGATKSRLRIEPWNDRHLEAAAAAFWRAHIGHIDSEFNDHYRSVTGASRYLRNILQFAGSATFCRPASYLSFDMTGEVLGMSLSSFVACDVAHITEICVVPQAKRSGVGYELLRQSVAALRGAGAERISLTVTAANEEAIRFYTRFGFRESRRFYAYAWDK